MDEVLGMMLFIVIILAAVIAVLAATNRIIFKMAVRNFSRRKIQSVIVIGGLMIGTAIISSSLVVQDTMVYMFEVDVYRSLGEVDEDWRRALRLDVAGGFPRSTMFGPPVAAKIEPENRTPASVTQSLSEAEGLAGDKAAGYLLARVSISLSVKGRL